MPTVTRILLLHYYIQRLVNQKKITRGPIVLKTTPLQWCYWSTGIRSTSDGAIHYTANSEGLMITVTFCMQQCIENTLSVTLHLPAVAAGCWHMKDMPVPLTNGIFMYSSVHDNSGRNKWYSHCTFATTLHISSCSQPPICWMTGPLNEVPALLQSSQILSNQHDDCMTTDAALFPDAIDLLMCFGLWKQHNGQPRQRNIHHQQIRADRGAGTMSCRTNTSAKESGRDWYCMHDSAITHSRAPPSEQYGWLR